MHSHIFSSEGRCTTPYCPAINLTRVWREYRQTVAVLLHLLVIVILCILVVMSVFIDALTATIKTIWLISLPLQIYSLYQLNFGSFKKMRDKENI